MNLKTMRAAALSLLACSGAWAEDAPTPSTPAPTAPASDIDSIPRLPGLVLSNGVSVLSAPANWESKDWGHFALGALAVVGTAALLDHPIRDAIQRNRTESMDKAANKLEKLGSTYAIATAGGFYLAGMISGDKEIRATGTDAISASLITGLVIVPAMKFAVGRARPSEDKGTAFFKPFKGGDPGFPSGHTTEAFAVASVITAHYSDTWVQVTAYGLASLAGLARMEQNQHFASDVVAGALIGYAVGKAVVRLNQAKRFGKNCELMVLPDIRPDGHRGMQARLVF